MNDTEAPDFRPMLLVHGDETGRTLVQLTLEHAYAEPQWGRMIGQIINCVAAYMADQYKTDPAKIVERIAEEAIKDLRGNHSMIVQRPSNDH